MISMIKIMILMSLISCNEQTQQINLSEYRCNKDQLDLVNREVIICNATSYYSSHCFASAKKSICDKITKENE